jgi:polyisoprenoid-binding protein YceI
MELNRTRTARNIALATACSLLLAGCPRAGRPPADTTPAPVPFELRGPLPADARLFQVVPEQSLVMILVYRAGALSKAGHNHVVASHELTGEVAFARDIAECAFAVRMPVASLTVDEPELRRAAGADFAAQIPDTAREGTRRNMLGSAVLDAEQFPLVALRSQNIVSAPGGALATLLVRVRDQSSTFSVPMHFEQKGRELLADGEFAVRQTDLGLTPFTALLGALQVQDEIRVRFRILARAT